MTRKHWHELLDLRKQREQSAIQTLQAARHDHAKALALVAQCQNALIAFRTKCAARRTRLCNVIAHAPQRLSHLQRVQYVFLRWDERAAGLAERLRLVTLDAEEAAEAVTAAQKTWQRHTKARMKLERLIARAATLERRRQEQRLTAITEENCCVHAWQRTLNGNA